MSEQITIITKSDTNVINTSETEVVIINSANQEVILTNQIVSNIEIITVTQRGETGLQGNTGPEGPPSTAVGYTHYQNVSSNVWLCNHNLGIIPTVSIWSVGMLEIMGDVINVSNNQTQINFTIPVAGVAKFI